MVPKFYHDILVQYIASSSNLQYCNDLKSAILINILMTPVTLCDVFTISW